MKRLEIQGPLLVFGGVYSNLQALEALLKEARRRGFDPASMLCTGDIAAYGADAKACLDILRDSQIACIAGNCEEQLAAGAGDCGCGYAPGSACDRLSATWFAHAQSQFNSVDRAWMGALPARLDVQVNGVRLAVVHGSLASNNRFVFASTPFRVKEHDADAARCDGVIAGHSGLPFTHMRGGKVWHNSGALGMRANDGAPHVWFSIIEPGQKERELTFHHIPLEYDHARAARAMRNAKLPEEYARALESGLWPNCDVMPAEEAKQGGKILQAGEISFACAEAGERIWPDGRQTKKLNGGKFENPDFTVSGEKRASVQLEQLDTLWINTGTLCNLSCASCYIESTPRNDRLAYISRQEVRSYLDEIKAQDLGTHTIGITGGEPFMNPDITGILEDALSGGFETIVLTNAMKPMRRFEKQLLELNAAYPGKMILRVSLDHYTQDLHELERGGNSWKPALDGLRWLGANGFTIHLAGRSYSGEGESVVRAGYQSLLDGLGLHIDCSDPVQLVLFPEMDAQVDVPEITESCWGILGKSPSQIMCSSSRIVVKRKGAESPSVLACTLLAYDPQFELGTTLAQARNSVALNHPHCAKFCVLGGAACSR